MSPDSPITKPVHLALCERDDCAWKYRGVTADQTIDKARAHVIIDGHTVSVYEGHTRIGRYL